MQPKTFCQLVVSVFVLCLSVSMPCADAHGIHRGTSRKSADPEEHFFHLDINELQTIDIRTGKPGWFGRQLENLHVDPYIHGYTAFTYRNNDINKSKSVNTFDLHYFNVILGVNIEDKIAAEALFEYEHSGDDTGVRYGIIDYKVAEPLTLRLGKFLVPMGKFNEYYSPEYANKLPDRPQCLRMIVPSVWAEVGAQIRGYYNFGSNKSINYAFYIVNGLEQAPNSDSSVAEGGSIRAMRRNHRDSYHSDKAYGGRIGYKPTQDIEIGASYYTGAYTIDSRQRLSIFDLDAEYHRNKVTLRGEYVMARQETSTRDLIKKGFYLEGAYRVNPQFEPVIRYDQADLDDGSDHLVQRSTIGLAFYPCPDRHPLFSFRFSQSFVHDDGRGDQTHEFVAQCVLGF